MKLALLGHGKTGSQVQQLWKGDIELFDRTNNPTYEKLMACDVIISFLPGDAFLHLIPLLVETKKPVVTGSTGFTWPVDLTQTLEEKKLAWICATNFSLGVVVIKQMMEKLNAMTHLFSEKTVTLHEVHHTKKMDAPSGTALSMQSWMDLPCEITSERTGDVVGLHTLKLETPSEIIRLEHEAKNRALFAEGAIWAANYLTQYKLEPGLHTFQKVVERHLSL